MARDTPVTARLIVVEKLSDRHYSALLPNGKQVIAHLERKAPDAWRHLSAGAVMIGELSPYDFDHARVVAAAISEE